MHCAVRPKVKHNLLTRYTVLFPVFTRSECQCELLGLDLRDLLRLQLLSHVLLAVGDGLVSVDSDASARVLDFAGVTVSALQGLQVVAASRLGFALGEEVLPNSKKRLL